MRLIIGAGDRQSPGWTHHDIQDLPGIDIVCDFWDLPQHIAPASCRAIHMTHVLEHFPMARTLEALRLVHGLLVPNGELYLEVPNFLWHAEEIVKDPRNRRVVEYAFGGQLNDWDYHYNGFTPALLFDDLLESDFRIVKLNPNSSIECWAARA